MTTLHLILQGKGGVGKSFASVLLAQYLITRGKTVMGVDVDPENPTFLSFKSLHVHQLKLVKNDEIDPTMFDKLIRLITDFQGDDIILDSGSSSFVALGAYLTQNDIIPTLASMGFTVIIHTIVAGGQEFMDTVTGAKRLAERFPTDAQLIIWKNEYKGEAVYQDETTGKITIFEKLKAFDDMKVRVLALVNLRKMPTLFENDIRKMMTRFMTFQEVMACDNKDVFDFLGKNRINKFRNEIFEQLDVAFGHVPNLKGSVA